MPATHNPGKKILVISHDVAGSRMAGPGIRYVSLASTLSGHFDTTLGLYQGTREQQRKLADTHDFSVEPFDERNYRELFDSADYIFAQWLSGDMLKYARRKRKRVIFDLYAPVPLEFLLFRYFSNTGFGKLEKHEFADTVERYKRYATLGDYFVCSNERQRDMWTGFFLANNTLEDRQESFTDISKLIGLCPMGISEETPEHTENVLRGTVPGIGKDDFVLLWTGGLWDWFDPLSVIKATEDVRQDDPRVKLVFLGTRHPNRDVPRMATTQEATDYARQNGMENESVFFVDEWLPHEERVNYLLEADAAIYAHKDSLEMRYSHRSRLLDHIHAGLPTIATGGDHVSDTIIAGKELGVVADNTVADLARAIRELAEDPDYRSEIRNNIANARPEFSQEYTARDLIEYVRDHAPESPISPYKGDEKPKTASRHYLRRLIRKLRRHVS
jgi:glycosyltransferase involved in cell wall biosynthesis